MTKPLQTTIATMATINVEDIVVKDDPVVEAASAVKADMETNLGEYTNARFVIKTII